MSVFTLNFLPYKPTRPVSSNIYRPTINSTGPNLKTTLMTINSNHQNSMTPQVFVINKSYNNIGCDDDDEEEEVDSDDMEYTEDAIDNMILEFSGD
jgi:hypothetical protein